MASTTGLAPILSADGTFVGSPGVAGTVDTAAWTLVSDLASGEAPRFARSAGAVSAASAPGSWTALGSNGSGNGALTYSLNKLVKTVAVSGSTLYVGGWFKDAAGIQEADYIAKWDGSHWSALGSNGSGDGALNLFVNALAVSGSDLYVGGDFSNAGGVATADNIAKWSGGVWSGLGSDGSGDGAFGINGYIDAVAVYNGDVYAGGAFPAVRGVPVCTGLARYSGGSWSAVGSGFDGSVSALLVSGGALYVGGGFATINGAMAGSDVAKWDGAWSSLGSGAGGVGGHVYALAASGSTIYAGGGFQNAGGIPQADYVAKWNGSSWSALGSNAAGTDGALLYATVYSLAASGNDVYVGGDFQNAAGILAADYMAKWNGSSWADMGTGTGSGGGAMIGSVMALTFSGSDLFAGGGFQNVVGIPEADCVAKWTPGAEGPPVATSITIKTTATTTNIGKTPILSGAITPVGVVGKNIVVYVMKPGKAYWTYSSNRTAYLLSGSAAWQYKYKFIPGMAKGTYKFKAVVPIYPGFLTSTSPTTVSIKLQ